jgi:tRNA(Ser,Leu) C12 N-acetylase TAN1
VVAVERYNLLVTFHPNRAGSAEREVRDRIEVVGGAVEDIERSSINGVFCIKVTGDAKDLVALLRADLKETPEMLSQTYHWVPVDRWVEASEEAMIEAVEDVADGIEESESWMMHVHKRHHPKHSEELMLMLTDRIHKGKVDLKHPEKIIAVEVLGSMAAISLLERNQIIDLNRLRLEAGLTQIA